MLEELPGRPGEVVGETGPGRKVAVPVFFPAIASSSSVWPACSSRCLATGAPKG